MRIDILYESGRVFLHIKEICFFAGAGDGRAAVGALTVNDLRLGVKGFAGLAVPALVFSLVDIALTEKSLEYLLYRLHMAFLGRADKAVVFHIHKIPYAAYLAGDLIDICLRIGSGFFGVILYLLSVLIGTGAEIHVIACLAAVTRYGICHDSVICVADVRLC